MNSFNKASLTIDARGLRCPLPILAVARRIQEIETGQLLELLADDPATGPDIHAWSRMVGHSVLFEQDGRWIIRREVVTNPLHAAAPPEEF